MDVQEPVPQQMTRQEFDKQAVRLRQLNRSLYVEIDRLNKIYEVERNQLDENDSLFQLNKMKTLILSNKLNTMKSSPHLFKQFITAKDCSTMKHEEIVEILQTELNTRQNLNQSIVELKQNILTVKNEIDTKKKKLKESLQMLATINKNLD